MGFHFQRLGCKRRGVVSIIRETTCLFPALGSLRGGWELDSLPQGCGRVPSGWESEEEMLVNALLVLEATSLILPSVLFPLFSPTSFSEL